MDVETAKTLVKEGTRKDKLIILTDALMQQMLVEFAVYMQDPSRVQGLRNFSAPMRVATTLFKSIKEYDWKEYSVNRGIARNLQQRKLFYTLFQTYLMAIENERPDAFPTPNTNLAVKYADAFYSSYNVRDAIQFYQVKKSPNFINGDNIARQLEDRDEFLRATVTNVSSSEAPLVGAHPLIHCLVPLLDISEPIFYSGNRSFIYLWKRAYYATCVNAYLGSWQRGSGGARVLSTVVGRGRLGVRADQSTKRRWYNEESSVPARERARQNAVTAIEEVSNTIAREVFTFSEIEQYYDKVSHFAKDGVYEFSPANLKRLMGQLCHVIAGINIHHPILLLSGELREMGCSILDEFSEYLTNSSPKNAPLKHDDIENCKQTLRNMHIQGRLNL